MKIRTIESNDSTISHISTYRKCIDAHVHAHTLRGLVDHALTKLLGLKVCTLRITYLEVQDFNS